MSAEQPSLLILDDDPDVRALIADAAQSMGFEVEATEKPEGVDAATFRHYDVLALDLMMPKRDGIEVLREMSGPSQPRIILISGLHERLLRSARQIADANGLQVAATLPKPFRITELRAALRKAHRERWSDGGLRSRPPLRFVPTAQDFAEALAGRQFVVHLQPQLRLADRIWSGVEVLARWQHPVHGLLSPASFVSLAETPEFARPFTEQVLELGMSAAARLEAVVGFRGDISVNLPPSAMTDVSLTERVMDQVIQGGFDPNRLVLEMTETSIPTHLGVALDIATRLRMRGVRLSIDDFGVGWSSLERLESAPFDELKIDMSFVRHAARDPSARAIVQNATRLGHDLRMTVVAEGVEDEATCALVRDLGCDLAQGYLFSAPLNTDALCDWARARAPVPEQRAYA